MQILETGFQDVLYAGETLRQPDGFSGVLLLLTGGSVTVGAGSQTVCAEAGDALLLGEKTPFCCTPVQDDLLYDWVLFDPGSDRSFYASLQIPENTLLRFGDTAFLSALMQQLCAEFYAANVKRSDMLDCLLKALLIRISETGGPIGMQNAAANSDPHYEALVRLREKIYANPQEKWSVEMLCSEVSMSRSYFQLIYRETFGTTCIADVINCKMNRARDLLTSTAYTISHLAQLCGYDNEEHFMRQFKKNNGVTPTVYRREHRE